MGMSNYYTLKIARDALDWIDKNASVRTGRSMKDLEDMVETLKSALNKLSPSDLENQCK
jgi:hypothetical protein